MRCVKITKEKKKNDMKHMNETIVIIFELLVKRTLNDSLKNIRICFGVRQNVITIALLISAVFSLSLNAIDIRTRAVVSIIGGAEPLAKARASTVAWTKGTP